MLPPDTPPPNCRATFSRMELDSSSVTSPAFRMPPPRLLALPLTLLEPRSATVPTSSFSTPPAPAGGVPGHRARTAHDEGAPVVDAAALEAGIIAGDRGLAIQGQLSERRGQLELPPATIDADRVAADPTAVVQCDDAELSMPPPIEARCRRRCSCRSASACRRSSIPPPYRGGVAPHLDVVEDQLPVVHDAGTPGAPAMPRRDPRGEEPDRGASRLTQSTRTSPSPESFGLPVRRGAHALDDEALVDHGAPKAGALER